MALNRYNTDRPLFGFGDHLVPFFDDPFKDLFMPVLPSTFDRSDDMTLLRSSPGYEINEVDGKYLISVDVPGVQAKDMNIDLENDGKVVHISGGRKVVKKGVTTETKFSKRFTVGDNVNIDQMSADLSNGVLTITAPIKEEVKPKPRRIAITTEGQAPMITDEKKE